jgi:alpha-tubulin suppressor-like RCC1 family protein
MCIQGNYLYIGGNFEDVVTPAPTANASTGQDGITNQCACVAKMNLTNGVWSAVDDGSLKLVDFYNNNVGNNLSPPVSYVLAIAVDSNGKVYVGSQPSDLNYNGNPLSQVMLATWNGTQWVTVGDGLMAWEDDAIGPPGYGPIWALAADGTDIYVAGPFLAGVDNNEGSVPSQFLIKWDGSQWDSISSDYSIDFAPGISSLIVSDPYFFVAGQLPYQVNGTWSYEAVNLFSTDGTQLNIDPLVSDNLDPPFYEDFIQPGQGVGIGSGVENGAVYLAGVFDTIDGQEGSVSPGVVEWTNGDFVSLGTGLGYYDNGTVYSGTANCVAADTNAVYVSAYPSSFSSAGGQSILYNSYYLGSCARWVTGPDRESGVVTLTPASFVGNTFTFTISGSPANCWTIQKLDRSGEWDSLCVVEVLTNAITFVDQNAYDNVNGRLPYYRAVNECVTAGGPIQQPISPFLSQAIALGGYFDLCVSNGFVWSWGLNQYGARGDNANNPPGTQLTTVLYQNSNDQYPQLTNIMSVAAGLYHALALDANGAVWSWGLGNLGQLGDGQSGDPYGPPLSFSYAMQVGNRRTGYLTGISSISAGQNSSYALGTNGTVWAWGYNASGQLGNDTTTTAVYPGKVTGLANIVAISGGGNHALALRADGTVWAWGANNVGQLGNNSTVNSSIPIEVPGLSDIIAIAAGGSSSYAVQSGGAVYAWGSDSSGQLGDNSNNNSLVPEQISALGNFPTATISACSDYCFVTDDNGDLWSWGDNSDGQLGQGTFGGMLGPEPVYFSDGSQTMEAARGSSAAYAALSLQNNLSVQAWGGNNTGQLGRTSGNADAPYYVTGFQ